MLTSPPAPESDLPTATVIAPPRPLVDDPVVTETDPEPALLAPELMDTSPELDAEVFMVDPVRTVMSPESVLPLLPSAVSTVTPPVVEVFDFPLEIVTLPPEAELEEPDVIVTSPPAPVPLVPTDRRMSPPTLCEADPDVIEMSPPPFRLLPVARLSSPDVEATVEAVDMSI